MHKDDHYKRVRTVALWGGFVNLALGLIKIIIGYLGHSSALVADGAHSLADLITDALVIVATRVSSHPADDNHPYGHARIETAMTAALAVIIMLVGVGLLMDAVTQFSRHEVIQQPRLMVVLAACLSILANEGLYHYTQHVAKQLGSNLLKANAWHHRSDALSSSIVLIAVVGSMYGAHYLDAIAAGIVSLMVLIMGVKLTWSSLRELVDTAVSEEIVKDIEATIDSVMGVRSVHQLRTRSMAGKIVIDAHIIVDPRISVSEGHYIAEAVQALLTEKMPNLMDMTVHIDAEDDEKYELNHIYRGIPHREQMLNQIRMSVQDLIAESDILGAVLHYLNGQVEVDLKLPLYLATDLQAAQMLQSKAKQALMQLPHVSRVRILFTDKE